MSDELGKSVNEAHCKKVDSITELIAKNMSSLEELAMGTLGRVADKCEQLIGADPREEGLDIPVPDGRLYSIERNANNIRTCLHRINTLIRNL